MAEAVVAAWDSFSPKTVFKIEHDHIALPPATSGDWTELASRNAVIQCASDLP